MLEWVPNTSLKLLTIFAKNAIVDIRMGPKYASKTSRT